MRGIGRGGAKRLVGGGLGGAYGHWISAGQDPMTRRHSMATGALLGAILGPSAAKFRARPRTATLAGLTTLGLPAYAAKVAPHSREGVKHFVKGISAVGEVAGDPEAFAKGLTDRMLPVIKERLVGKGKGALREVGGEMGRRLGVTTLSSLIPGLATYTLARSLLPRTAKPTGRTTKELDEYYVARKRRQRIARVLGLLAGGAGAAFLSPYVMKQLK